MEKKYWDDLWTKNDIEFHMSEVNPALIKFGKQLLDVNNKKAFIPLCGKTLDLIWFSERCDHVYGVELSEKAILEFFNENSIEFTKREEGEFKIFEGRNISVYCGDFFKFPIKELEIDIVFDRGSLVALPLGMRADYLTKFKNELSQGARWLLCVFEYPQEKMEGPPFSVSLEEIESGLDKAFHITRLDRVAFNDFEIDAFFENTYIIKN